MNCLVQQVVYGSCDWKINMCMYDVADIDVVVFSLYVNPIEYHMQITPNEEGDGDYNLSFLRTENCKFDLST